MIAMTIEQIVSREGIGDVLANGIAPAAEHFGDPGIGMHVKNQGVPAYDPRGIKGMGIAYATSNRGACHLRAYTPASELGLIPMKTDPLAWKGKGELAKLLQDLHAFSATAWTSASSARLRWAPTSTPPSTRRDDRCRDSRPTTC